MAVGADGVLPPGVADVSTALKAQLDVHSCVFVRGVHENVKRYGVWT